MIIPRGGHVHCSPQRVGQLSPLEREKPDGLQLCFPLHSSMPVASSYQCLISSLLLISSLILLSYFFAQFPHAPQGYSVHPSLASLGSETKAKEVYPEDYYAGGAYVSLPFGNVRPFPYPCLTAFPITHRGNCCAPGPLLVVRPRIGKEGSKSPFVPFPSC